VKPAPEHRAELLMGVAGLATYLASVLVANQAFHFAHLGTAVAILVGLIAINVGLAVSAPLWTAWRGVPALYGGLHAVVMTFLLHLLGRHRLGLLFIVYIFPVFHSAMLGGSERSVFVTANLCAVAYGALALAEVRGWLPGTDFPLPGGQEAALVLLGFLTLNFLAIYANRYGAQLRHFAGRLQQRVAERTAELTAVNQELGAKAQALEDKQEQLKTFVYIVTHDLKNPVSAVLLTADLLLGREGGALSAEGREDLERIVRLAGGTEDMIRDLLGLFRITSAPEAPGWVALDDLVGRALETLGPQVAVKGVRVDVGRLPRVWGQPGKLGAVVANLLSNAVKYVPADRGEIVVRGGVENGHVVVSVADNGIGIAAPYHRGIFELFGRVPAGEQQVDGQPAGGTGVGLAIVKRVVDAHHGTVAVESSPGAGSRFTVCLPGAPEPPEGPRA
jgi:signal transduction histidine kinase